MKLSSLRYAIAAVTVCASTAQAQVSVHVVDPTDPALFAEISDAIVAAAPGDIVLVREKPSVPAQPFSHLYDPITIDKAITIVADAGEAVNCRSAVITGLTTSEEVLLRDIVFERPDFGVTQPSGGPNLSLENGGVRLLVEGCTFRPIQPSAWPGQSHPAVSLDGGAGAFVTFVDSTIVGKNGTAINTATGEPSAGLFANNIAVSMWGCDVRGGKGWRAISSTGILASEGAAAVVNDSGFIFASDTLMTGGAGGDALIGSCSQGGNGGAGIVLQGNTAFLHSLNAVRTGGQGGDGCPAGAAGPDDVIVSGGITEFTGPSYSTRVSSPHRAGETLTIDVEGEPGHAYFGLIGASQNFDLTAGVPGMQLLSPLGGTSTVFFSGLYDGAGQGQHTSLLSGPPGGLPGISLLFQNLSVDPTGTAFTWSSVSSLLMLE